MRLLKLNNFMSEEDAKYLLDPFQRTVNFQQFVDHLNLENLRLSIKDYHTKVYNDIKELINRILKELRRSETSAILFFR